MSAVSPLLQEAAGTEAEPVFRLEESRPESHPGFPTPDLRSLRGVQSCVSPQLGDPGGTCTHRRSSREALPSQPPFPPARSRLEGSCRLSPVVTLQGTGHLEASWQPPCPHQTDPQEAGALSLPAALGCLWVLRPSPSSGVHTLKHTAHWLVPDCF